MPARRRRRDYPCKGPDCLGRTPHSFGFCPSCTAALADIRRALAERPRQSEAAKREDVHRAKAAIVNEMGRGLA